VIQIEELYKTLEGNEVLRGATFGVEKGELAALIGVSGEGKSVTLRHITGLMRPDAGRVMVDGREIGKLNGRQLRRIRTRMGYLFQGGALFDSMTVYDNVAFPLREKTRLGESEIERKVYEELAQVGLADAADKFPGELSGGMAKRAALARAMIGRPEIMLFDEPTTGLDRIVQNAIANLIHDCHERHQFTGIIVSHHIPHIFSVVQKVIMLHNGEVRYCGSSLDILRCDDPVVQQFISGDVQGPLPHHTAHWRVPTRIRKRQEKESPG
jgi:phospholipid/cholesterol/gamma-HCH transport system ATP-binding protein